MKKTIVFLLTILLCSISVSAYGDDSIKACETLSNNEQVCSVDEDGECECVNNTIGTKGKDQQGAN